MDKGLTAAEIRSLRFGISELARYYLEAGGVVQLIDAGGHFARAFVHHSTDLIEVLQTEPGATLFAELQKELARSEKRNIEQSFVISAVQTGMFQAVNELREKVDRESYLSQAPEILDVVIKRIEGALPNLGSSRTPESRD